MGRGGHGWDLSGALCDGKAVITVGGCAGGMNRNYMYMWAMSDAILCCDTQHQRIGYQNVLQQNRLLSQLRGKSSSRDFCYPQVGPGQ